MAVCGHGDETFFGLLCLQHSNTPTRRTSATVITPTGAKEAVRGTKRPELCVLVGSEGLGIGTTGTERTWLCSRVLVVISFCVLVDVGAEGKKT